MLNYGAPLPRGFHLVWGLVKSAWAALNLEETGFGYKVKQVQERIEHHVLGTISHTLYGGIVASDKVEVSVSQAAYDSIRPVERRAIQEIERHVSQSMQELGWEGDPISIKVRVDRSLSGLAMEARALDEDATTDWQPRTLRPGTNHAPTTTPWVRLVRLDTPDRPAWAIPSTRPIVVGRLQKGRKSPEAELHIEHPAVSRSHLTLSVIEGGKGLEIMDHSRNGSFLDGAPLPQRVRIRVSNGQVIELGAGGARLRVDLVQPNDQAATQPFGMRDDS